MNYTLKLFRNVEFSPNDNAVVGKTADLEAYLSSRLVFATTTQNLVKLRPSLSIVVNIGDYSINYLKINYCEIIAPGNGVRNQWFYFVDSVEFVSNKAIRVNLSIDSLNTFYWTTNFYSDCHIVRRFKDRWMKTANSYFPVYDRSSEGFEINQVLDKNKTKIICDFSGDSVKAPEWLMATGDYTSGSGQSHLTRYYPVPVGSSAIKADYTDIANQSEHVRNRNLSLTLLAYDEDVTGEPVSVSAKDSSGTQEVTFKATKVFHLPYYPPVLSFTGTASGLVDAGHSKTGNYMFRGDWDKPSVASNNYVVWFDDSAYSTLQVISESRNNGFLSRRVYAGKWTDFGLNQEFAFKSPTGSTKEERQGERRNYLFSADDYDPKLGTSEFTTCKVEFLGSSFTIAPEREEGQRFGGVDIQYYVSPNSTNPVRFRIEPLNWNGVNKYEYQDDDRGYLVPTADLSFPMWTSDYNQYMNYSNRYDRLSSALSYGSAGAGVISGIAGVATGAIAGPVGRAVGVTGARFSGLSSAIGTWNNQQAKLQSMRQQSMNVSQSSIDFAYLQTENKLRLLRYDIPDYLKKSLTNYFHLFGYATDEYANPYTYNNTRYAYDFMKLDFVHYNKGSLEEAFREDFEAKLKDGYYIYHVLVDYTPTAFDFEHKNGNMEVSLIEGRE